MFESATAAMQWLTDFRARVKQSGKDVSPLESELNGIKPGLADTLLYKHFTSDTMASSMELDSNVALIADDEVKKRCEAWLDS